MGGSSNTGKYKSFKEMPFWLKLIVVGAPALVLIMLPLQIFLSLENKEFDAELERKIERIHRQIAEGSYREIFIEGDRELVANYDESEFAAKLAKGRNQLSGKYKKMTGSSLYFPDVYNRVKRLFGRPALVHSFYSFKSDTHAGREAFYWILRGDEIRLADYEFYELKRQDYH
jgi:hypothetical protein